MSGCSDAGCTSFSDQCKSIMLGLGPSIPGLVDINGNPMSELGNSTWGIDYSTCQRYCNWTVIRPLVRDVSQRLYTMMKAC